MDRNTIEAALDEGRLIVKTSTGWFAARKTKVSEFEDGTWIIHVRTKKRARGLITNIDGNTAGREFRIV